MKKVVSVLAVTMAAAAVGYSVGSRSRVLEVPYKPMASEAGSLLGKINGTPIKEEDLQKEVLSRLYQVRSQEYEVLNKQFRSALFELLSEKEAKEKKVPKSEYIKGLLSSVKEPSQSEVQKFAKKYNIDLSKDKSLEQRIKAKLKEDSMEKKRELVAAELLSKNEVEVYFSKPRLALAYSKDASPAIGDKSSKNKVVVFRDLKTEEGKKVSSVAERLASKDTVVIFKDYAQGQGQGQDYSVQAQLCVHEKMGLDKYLSSAEKLSRMKDQKDVDAYVSGMKDVLDCVKSNRHQLTARANLIQALGLGLSGQSAIVVNGVVLKADEADRAAKHLVK